MSPDGESVVTGAGDETLRFWNIFSKSNTQKVWFCCISFFLIFQTVEVKNTIATGKCLQKYKLLCFYLLEHALFVPAFMV